ncbi:hypothetical protein HHI36_010988 [Cryptolaemus montrouzieri]|uniref:C2H2-type domain-containing protein n=1 Tax=Cryptolaemus montrouzieri TaxID=559131 RepID=A0ABD2MKF0_9CUCU
MYEKIELKVENYGNETVGGSVELKLSEEDNITDHELTDTYQLQSHEECMYQHRGELKTINDKTEIVLKIKDESLVEIKSLKYEYINTDGKIRYEGVKIDQENFSDKVIDKCQTNFPEMKSKLADVIASKIEDELFKKDCKTIAHKLIDVDRKVTNCDSGNIEKVISTIQRETLEDNWNNAHVFNMHRCDHCDYSTARKSTLKNHAKNLHLQIKNFTCGHCGYQTNKKFHLKLHIESIHLGIKITIVVCVIIKQIINVI